MMMMELKIARLLLLLLARNSKKREGKNAIPMCVLASWLGQIEVIVIIICQTRARVEKRRRRRFASPGRSRKK